MVDPVAIVAIALLVGGVLATLIPLVPGGALSLTGLVLYWWRSGFDEPGTIALVVLVSLAGLTLVVELFGSPAATRASGGSWTTTVAATVVGIALMLVTGPAGLLVGLFGTVFLLEFARNGDLEHSARTALWSTVGTLASTAVQVLLTLSILLGFLVAVFVL